MGACDRWTGRRRHSSRLKPSRPTTACSSDLRTRAASLRELGIRERERASGKRLLARVGVAALIAVTVTAFVVAGVLERRRTEAEDAREDADIQRAEADRQAGLALREQGRRELMDGSALKALVYLNSALRKLPTDPITRFLVARAQRVIDRKLLTLEGHEGGVRSAAYSPDGSRVLTVGTRDGAPLRCADRQGACRNGRTRGQRSLGRL